MDCLKKEFRIHFYRRKSRGQKHSKYYVHELIIFTITSLHYLVVHTILTIALCNSPPTKYCCSKLIAPSEQRIKLSQKFWQILGQHKQAERTWTSMKTWEFLWPDLRRSESRWLTWHVYDRQLKQRHKRVGMATVNWQQETAVRDLFG